MNQDDWIPCAERMPEIDSTVLICTVDGDRKIAVWDNYWLNGVIVPERSPCWYTAGPTSPSRAAVTHWMPLPPPPRKEP